MKEAHGKRLFSVYLLAFAVSLGGGTALADFYVIPAASKAKRTVLASPTPGDPVKSGTNLLNALSGIMDSSANNWYVLKIEPGVYDIGSSTLQMKPYVDVEGSGEISTTIIGNRAGYGTGVVSGAIQAELRFLSVKNIGGSSTAIAIYYEDVNQPRITHVSAWAEGATNCFAIYNNNSSPIMTHVTAVGAGQGVSNAYGIYNDGGAPTLIDVNARASSASNNAFGVYNTGHSNVVMKNGSARGILSGNWNYGVYNQVDSNMDLFGVEVLAYASSGNGAWGVLNTSTGGNVYIDCCYVYGDTRSVRNDNQSSSVRIGASKLRGGVEGTVTCACVYVDPFYTFYPDTCP